MARTPWQLRSNDCRDGKDSLPVSLPRENVTSCKVGCAVMASHHCVRASLVHKARHGRTARSSSRSSYRSSASSMMGRPSTYNAASFGRCCSHWHTYVTASNRTRRRKESDSSAMRKRQSFNCRDVRLACNFGDQRRVTEILGSLQPSNVRCFNDGESVPSTVKKSSMDMGNSGQRIEMLDRVG